MQHNPFTSATLRPSPSFWDCKARISHRTPYAKQTRARHQQIVLDFYGFMAFGGEAEAALGHEIATRARRHLKPRLMFARYADCLIQHRVRMPRVGMLLELIRAGLPARKAERVAMMEAHLTDETRDLLNDLFNARAHRPDKQADCIGLPSPHPNFLWSDVDESPRDCPWIAHS